MNGREEVCQMGGEVCVKVEFTKDGGVGRGFVDMVRGTWGKGNGVEMARGVEGVREGKSK